MNRLNFLIDWFYKENDRRTSLNEYLNIPIGILTVVFGLIFFMFTSFSFALEQNSIIKVSFVILIIITLVLGIIVVAFLFLSYNIFGSYKAMPYPKDLNEQYKKLEQYVEENKKLLDKNETVDSIYENQLIDMFSECLDCNIKNNDKKANYLYLAKIFLFGCVISVILCAIPFAIHFCSNKEVENIQKISNKRNVL